MPGDLPDDLLSEIVADAAERSGMTEGGIEVIEATEITWNDGALGCPQPGQTYTQALVDGYHIIIEAGDQRLDYRAPLRGGFRLCENPIRGASGDD